MDRRDRGRSAPSSPYPQGPRRGRMMQASNHSFGTGIPTTLTASSNSSAMSFGASPRTQHLHQLVSQSSATSNTTDYGILPTGSTSLSGQAYHPGTLHHWNHQLGTTSMSSPTLPHTPGSLSLHDHTQSYPPWTTVMNQQDFQLQNRVGGGIPLPLYQSSESSIAISEGAFPTQSRYQHETSSIPVPFVRSAYALQQRCEELQQRAIPASTSEASSYNALTSGVLLATHYASPGIQPPLQELQPLVVASQPVPPSEPFLTAEQTSPETLPPLLEPQPVAPADAMEALTLADGAETDENVEEGKPTVRGRANDRKATAAGRAELRSGAKRSASLRACQFVYKEGEHLFSAKAVTAAAGELQTRFTAQVVNAKAECESRGVKFKNMADKEADLLFHSAAQSQLQRQAYTALNGQYAALDRLYTASKREIAQLRAQLSSFQASASIANRI